MPQHALDYRRVSTMRPPGYETMARGPVAADAGMLARHELRVRPGAPARAAAALELRRRQLELLELASGD